MKHLGQVADFGLAVALSESAASGVATRVRPRNPEPGTQNPELETRNPEPETRNPEPGTQDPTPETRNPEP